MADKTSSKFGVPLGNGDAGVLQPKLKVSVETRQLENLLKTS